LQELHESSISKALEKATKVADSSQEAPPPIESITESPEVMETHSNWRTPFMVYHRTGGLPKEKVDREGCHRAGHYTLVNEELFRRGANGTLMKCITLDEGCAILQDVHVGICGNHTGARTLMGKAYR
jgi:hypothetical protein